MKKKDENDSGAVDVRNVDCTAEWPRIVEDSPVVVELESVGFSRKEFCRILSRYKHYTEGGVASDVLAPYHRQWLEHAVLLLELQDPARWPSLSEDEHGQLIEELRHKILKGYIRAAKTSVVNYACLMNPLHPGATSRVGSFDLHGARHRDARRATRALACRPPGGADRAFDAPRAEFQHSSPIGGLLVGEL